MLAKLHINTNERIGDADGVFTECLVNLDAVQVYSPVTNGSGKTKLKFSDGYSIVCRESMDFILATYTGNIDTGYKAPEPKDA